MRALPDLLLEVRKLIAIGWDPYTCREASGLVCTIDDEGVAVFDLLGAVQTVTQTVEEDNAVWAALDAATDGLAFSWCMAPGRTQSDVMRAIARAERRAAMEAA